MEDLSKMRVFVGELINKYLNYEITIDDTIKQMPDLEKNLFKISFSEMAPYYIMRYGFYEGHTEYRTDPIAVSFIFGLKSLEEIDRAFDGNLYEALTKHFQEDWKTKPRAKYFQ